ncbi:MAG: FAD-dependent oxidoreductase [Actinomycetota bacterium]|nr:FAD-dependent oxidoreductase [Actinomycetota bacterium]
MPDNASLDPGGDASGRPLRVAVVGAGPAGLFIVDALTDSPDVPVSVEIVDRIPTPFGLLRYGVAPDHPAIRSIRNRFTALLHRDDVTFLGGVEIGRDVTVDDLREHVDAIVYSYGSASDRHLDVPGEDLLGSLSATEFVAWYCGHPDADRALVEDAVGAGGSDAGVRSVVVVGAGNVALDVARVLARNPAELVDTDMPGHVLAVLAETAPQEVHLLARRGPADVAFSTPELRELGQLTDAAVVLADPDIDLSDPPEASRTAGRNLAVLRDWAQAGPAPPGQRRVVLHFWSRPVRLKGAGPPGRERVRAVSVEPTELDEDGRLIAAGPPHDIPADLVLRAVGYRGVKLPGVPFDEVGAVVPNEAGRVLGIGADGRPVATGEYVTGWAKRGPRGVIGTNKPDARETARAVLADAPGLLRRRDPGGLAAWLTACGTPAVDTAGWDRIDAAEMALGQTEGRERTTLADRAAMLAAADHDPDEGPEPDR